MLELFTTPDANWPVSGLLTILYLDPGSGSMIIQLLVAGALAALFFFRGSWRKLVNKFHKPKGHSGDKNDHEDW